MPSALHQVFANHSREVGQILNPNQSRVTWLYAHRHLQRVYSVPMSPPERLANCARSGLQEIQIVRLPSRIDRFGQAGNNKPTDEQCIAMGNPEWKSYYVWRTLHNWAFLFPSSLVLSSFAIVSVTRFVHIHRRYENFIMEVGRPNNDSVLSKDKESLDQC